MSQDQNEFVDDIWEQSSDSDLPAASSRLKSQLYSKMIATQELTGPLVQLGVSKAQGQELCVFEQIMASAPVKSLQEYQYCKICHARVLGEAFENAPIFWPNCPYAEFQK